MTVAGRGDGVRDRGNADSKPRFVATPGPRPGTVMPIRKTSLLPPAQGRIAVFGIAFRVTLVATAP